MIWPSGVFPAFIYLFCFYYFFVDYWCGDFAFADSILTISNAPNLSKFLNLSKKKEKKIWPSVNSCFNFRHMYVFQPATDTIEVSIISTKIII